jgi:PRTRC genetic system protein C
MALQVNSQRKFKFNKIMLDDPNPNFTPEEVMNFYSNEYPELTTANITGPQLVKDSAVYSFTTIIGDKG